jgi:hypothetical protein
MSTGNLDPPIFLVTWSIALLDDAEGEKISRRYDESVHVCRR